MLILHKIINLLLPSRCVVCDNRLEVGEKQICLMCNMGISRYENEPDFYNSELAKQFYLKADVERVGAFIKFYPGTKPANIFYTKYFGNSEAPYVLGRMAAVEMKGSGFFDGIDGIVSVPLTVSRQMKRGFNQCDSFARGLSKETGIPVLTYTLIRNDFKTSQTNLNYMERQENVKGVFHVIDPDTLRDKHVLLVDDIITTGATTVSAAKSLLAVPGCRVSVLGIGRTSH